MSVLRPLYAALLAFSGLVTLTLGSLTWWAPERIADGFGVTLLDDPGVDLLMAVLGGAVLSLALIVFLAAWWVWNDRPEGRTLGLLSAATLILVALGGYGIAGATSLLWLDGTRGLVLLAVGWFYRPASAAGGRRSAETYSSRNDDTG